ncbi:indolepyruvate ferredoxin oxidoreductase family protein [Xanthobacter dioxanivorans]|uniref:Indolepyruvate ferredoxin oxidoreductase family protein n=1 Tax=Xanthobacter dioxanivorans TaxID=2528964 RepID=A0A974PU72_9HYPH|nr:indolepyruvate ferredoxin oxidoreductase family protein [Xanthobacter dioxanivorans]QRG09170.1 indolepyruvate ferredoxin oxidoreductase family protein [Xanthobacter dioxanivorans]
MALKPVSLDDKYDLSQERVFVSGTQALVRLALMQKERDRRAGLNTAGYVTGYRGSPLGGLDQQFLRAEKLLKANDIKFMSGLNEDLAATALWGSQQAELRGEGKFDGVFGLWYGKGPGVDRSGDVFRHANNAGTSKHGGVLALMGDDHTCESSTTAHQSEFHFVDVMIPVLNPAGAQEIIDYGLYGWALSRFSGAWVGLKAVKDTIESTGIVDGRLDRVRIEPALGFQMPPGGLNIRLGDTPLAQEERLQEFKRDAVLHFLRANRLNRFITSGGARPRIGIATVGKSYLDVRLALDELGIDEVRANDLGLRIWKVACPWPLETQGLMEFARGLDLIMVVEEKRSLIEVQVREELYGTANQPVCIGKKDEEGRWLFPVKGALDPNDIAIQLGKRLLAYGHIPDIAARVAELEEAQRVLAATSDVATRIPYFCSGCPHNSSTKVPEGMRAYAGIGCHYMVQWMDRETTGFTQMGGEGANWIGESSFSKRPHVFQNLGDGTYNHSGYLALRASCAAKVNVTYKILFNDAVAMTGGQKHDGDLTVPVIARQVAAEGVERVVVVTDEPDKYAPNTHWPAGLTIHHRDELEAVQRELAAIPGVTVLIYDQTCASEKRRRRKRGQFPDPDKRVLINERVCEGCGDCGVKSNCVSVQPLETEWGRKREIDQSSCNKDFSCVNGFCPSFVTVKGAKPKKSAGAASGAQDWPELPEPAHPEIDGTYGIIATGVGGTGVVTIGAILGMAAHLEGKACGMIDMAGLAQKGGAVYSHIRLAHDPADITAIRVPARGADVVLGGDLVVAGTKKVLAAVKPGKTIVVVNTHEVLPGDFTRNADYSLPTERIKRTIRDLAGGEMTHFIEASRLALALFGNALAQNIFMVGYAYQFGALPLSAEAIEKAIELNGEAVAMNKAAFLWGRRAAHDPAAVAKMAAPQGEAQSDARRLSETLDEVIARRVKELTLYQNAAYAARYKALVDKVRAAEGAKAPGRGGLAEAVAKNLFKLMATKDEYEVARLYADGAFVAQARAAFDGDLTFEFHLAPPLLARKDPITGEPKKMTLGPWMMRGFGLLAKLKGLRGTPFDVFGYTAERKTERALIGQYERTVEELVARLDGSNHALAVAIASIPEKIRGFGHVKARHLQAAKAEEAALLARLRAPPEAPAVAAE